MPPSFWEIERPISLPGGKSFVGLFDPKRPVEPKETEKYGTRYIFAFTSEETGKPVRMEGGARLYEAIAEALGRNPDGSPSEKVAKLKITAHGARGTTDYGFTAEKLE